MAIDVSGGTPLRAMLKFWPGIEVPRLPSGAVALNGGAFDWRVDLQEDGMPSDAAGVLLTLVSGAATTPLPPVPSDPDRAEHAAEGAPLCPPLSLWRARDGWLLVHTATGESWRNFCATFLNRSAYRDVPADRAWADAGINHLATIILDTHKVDDAVGTCLTYQVPAAAVPGWHDRERGAEGRALAERLAWAALAPFGDGLHSPEDHEVPDGRQSDFRR